MQDPPSLLPTPASDRENVYNRTRSVTVPGQGQLVLEDVWACGRDGRGGDVRGVCSGPRTAAPALLPRPQQQTAGGKASSGRPPTTSSGVSWTFPLTYRPSYRKTTTTLR
ncbi:hypothetical protein Pmani_016255 [Petrolisthes manimaculis]|uniref:Uncharacterized protein n=1 Tax=Petrolisthes manimaculis TaxID=1843537 RepID=A0AAE1U6W4_9EUCA|nr:hypothetical protein Pmani_016255 [Petrolisthes manimaculis]